MGFGFHGKNSINLTNVVGGERTFEAKLLTDF